MKSMKKHFSLIIFFSCFFFQPQYILAYRDRFIRRHGIQLTLGGKPYYANGFNAYWLMYIASNHAGADGRQKVSNTFRRAASRKLTVARTWAFSDGGDWPLQYSPSSYNEEMFKGLDYVVHRASQYGIKLILSLVNNYNDFGGKQQYVVWANSSEFSLKSEDDFFTSTTAKSYYKNHISKVVNRRNTFNGRLYKNDPTIMAWELMNEPRCSSVQSAQIIEAWIKEMARYVKSIDRNHLVEVGLEGFYGRTSKRARFNPNNVNTGTDFIANNQIPEIDFATLHSYPDAWLPNSNAGQQLSFLKKWLDQHILDARSVLKKPLLMAEFGMSREDPNFIVSRRDAFFNTVYSRIAKSAIRNGPGIGGLFWQLLAKGMESYGDGYAISLEEQSSTLKVITRQALYLNKIQRQWRLHARARRDQRLAWNP